MTVVRWAETTPEAIAPGRTRYLAHTDDLMVVVIDFEDGPHAEPDPRLRLGVRDVRPGQPAAGRADEEDEQHERAAKRRSTRL